MPQNIAPDPRPGRDTPDSLREQAAACRRLAASSRTRSGQSSLEALADHFEKQAVTLDPIERVAVSRVVHLRLDEGAVVTRCLSEKVGVSAIERLPAGGVRLVCMSNDGAGRTVRRKLKQHLIKGEVERLPYRP